MATRFSEEAQREVVSRAAKGEKIADLAQEYGFAATTFPKWKAKWGKVNHRAKLKVTTRKIARKNPLKEENENLREEANFWKNMYTDLLHARNKSR